MNRTELNGILCKWAVPKDGGGLFWQTGTKEGEDESHFYFKVNGQLVAFRRADVIKIEFLQPMPSAAARGAV